MTEAGSSQRRTRRPASSSTPVPSSASARSTRRVNPSQQKSAPDADQAGSDALLTALELWRAVVAGLRDAQYAEVGATYGRLSELLVRQRAAELLTDAADRREWEELQRTAAEAVALLEPVTTAARKLARLPGRAEPSPDTPAARPDSAAAPRRRAARRRTSE